MSAGPSLAEQITELSRELRLRHRVYPNYISRGMLKEPEARVRVARLEAAIFTLHTLENKLNAANGTSELDFGPPATTQLDPATR